MSEEIDKLKKTLDENPNLSKETFNHVHNCSVCKEIYLEAFGKVQDHIRELTSKGNQDIGN